jgi:hypothetical protein
VIQNLRGREAQARCESCSAFQAHAVAGWGVSVPSLLAARFQDWYARAVRYALVAAAWFVAAIAIGASGTLRGVRPPAPQLVVAGCTIALLAAWRFHGGFREWLQRLDLRWLVALHLSRFVGVSFLVLCRSGELACAFAQPAGWGDIAVATLAGVLLVTWNSLARLRTAIGIWNALGLVDIVFVVVNAARIGMANPESLAPLVRLPLCLLPTFLVPLIIASHVVIFSRLSSERQNPA